jgi:hypothetical protein
MPYSQGTRLPGEAASKLGHLPVVKSEWVSGLVHNFEFEQTGPSDGGSTRWVAFESDNTEPLRSVWATDGSYVPIRSTDPHHKEVAFVKTALITLDKGRLDLIDKVHPHPLLLQDILAGSAVFHATVFPLKNVRTPLGTNYDAVRHITRDSMRIDENGAYYQTLKWLAYRLWGNDPIGSPAFECPHCHVEVEGGLPPNADGGYCPHCGAEIFLTDMLGLHLDMDVDSAPENVASSYMLIMEHLMLFTAIRLLWEHSDRQLLCDTLFIKDGPLSLGKQYSKLVPSIRAFIQNARDKGRPLHIIGQEKSGAFADHLASIGRYAAPHVQGEPMSYAVLTHDYVRKEVYRVSNLSSPYGSRTNWGEKLYLKLDPGTQLVLNVPTGAYNPADEAPLASDLIGLQRILRTLPDLISRKYEGALFPIELANGIASMSSYPSAKVLERFASARAGVAQ